MAARRAAVDERFAALEARVTSVEGGLQRVKRDLGEVRKSCHVVLEGFDKVESAWAEHAPSQLWRERRLAVPKAVGEDLCEALQVPWPLPQEDSQEFQALGDTGRAISQIVSGLAGADVLAHVFDQSRNTAGGRSRVEGTFRLTLRFGEESLSVQAALSFLDGPLRTAAGLPVRGRPAPPRAEGAPAPKRRLAYAEATPEERERKRARQEANGGGPKGRGGKSSKGRGGKNGGKGKGKKGAKGKGKGKAQGKAPAAPAAEPAASAPASSVAPAPAAAPTAVARAKAAADAVAAVHATAAGSADPPPSGAGAVVA
ncbi:unnamed protein product [Prorocentrum cordatum]|uniref:Uncharacterized protein n=1 Tax=Prorocentrum cordatum TaxID=2364126 RepID=A0ABN9T1I2_9DINO|nr:unnamed protein product [Polarella glacialis]